MSMTKLYKPREIRQRFSSLSRENNERRCSPILEGLTTKRDVACADDIYIYIYTKKYKILKNKIQNWDMYKNMKIIKMEKCKRQLYL